MPGDLAGLADEMRARLEALGAQGEGYKLSRPFGGLPQLKNLPALFPKLRGAHTSR